MTTERIIKKYPNRRLYDTTLRTYITLDDVKNLVFDRMDFKVIDARTNKDLTQSTLLQIITEQEANSNPIFTTQILQEFIRFYHEKSHGAFTEYLEQAMLYFVQQKDFFQKQLISYQKLFPNPFLLPERLLINPKDNEHKAPRKQKRKKAE